MLHLHCFVAIADGKDFLSKWIASFAVKLGRFDVRYLLNSLKIKCNVIKFLMEEIYKSSHSI